MHQLNPYHLVQTDQADGDKRAFLAAQLRQYNNVHSPAHLQIRTDPPQPLDLFVHNAAGDVVGGLVADTYWSWLDIDKLWLADELRGRGYGRYLLQLAEAEAQQRGCRHAFLTTFSFQARGFYEKAGFQVVGILDDYPPGQRYFWMRKNFA